MGGSWWWPFGGKGEPKMSASSRVTCYDNRDEYFACLGGHALCPARLNAKRKCRRFGTTFPLMFCGCVPVLPHNPVALVDR
eukprot:143884-Rhodomonas_salina.6